MTGGKKMAKKSHHEKDDNLIAQNKKARHDYSVLETYEAGIALTGTEIKSVRARASILKMALLSFITVNYG